MNERFHDDADRQLEISVKISDAVTSVIARQH